MRPFVRYIASRQNQEKPISAFYKIFFDNKGKQKKWITPFTICFAVFFPLLLSTLGIILSLDNSDNKQQIGHLAKQIDYLRMIYAASDSTNKSTQSLRDLPSRLSYLSQTLDTLNFTIAGETKKLENSYSALNANYDMLIEQQKGYLDKISRIVELTNTQITALEKNNKVMNQEFSKRPEIKIYAQAKLINGKYHIEEFVIKNSGDIEFDLHRFLFGIIDSDCSCPDSLKITPNWQYLNKNVYEWIIYKDALPRIINGTGLRVPMKEGCTFNTKQIEIEYKVDYTSKYESKPQFGRVIITY